MRRIKLIVAYDGTEYSGWQIQPEAPTIEMYLDKAIRELTGENVHVTGASRTDAGVHAYGNVAVFDTESRIPAEKFAYALNARLPEDIVVQKSCEAAPDYHPRHCSTIKTYEYHILNRTFRLPQMRNNTFFCHYALDVEAMNEAAQYLVGEHDFKSFCSVNTQAETTVRTIYSIEVTGRSLSTAVPDSEDEDGGEKFDIDRGREIVIRVSGNGFLYNLLTCL